MNENGFAGFQPPAGKHIVEDSKISLWNCRRFRQNSSHAAPAGKAVHRRQHILHSRPSRAARKQFRQGEIFATPSPTVTTRPATSSPGTSLSPGGGG